MYELHTDLAFQDIRNTSVARVYCGLFTILSRSLYATRRVTTRSRLRSFRISDIQAWRDISPYKYGRTQCQRVGPVWVASYSWSLYPIGIATSFHCICKHNPRFNVCLSLIAGHQGGWWSSKSGSHRILPFPLDILFLRSSHLESVHCSTPKHRPASPSPGGGFLGFTDRSCISCDWLLLLYQWPNQI